MAPHYRGDRLDYIAETVAKIDAAINGPEGQPERGIIIRLDRVERSNKSALERQKWIARTALGAIVAALVPYAKAAIAWAFTGAAHQ